MLGLKNSTQSEQQSQAMSSSLQTIAHFQCEVPGWKDIGENNYQWAP